ncbi:Structural maintenance of chromosomes protein 6 [Haplosporangium sp. Z 11]|nr:Structural maintenance of chromosomes protein 6 [Haplosporangium sp. Z 11]
MPEPRKRRMIQDEEDGEEDTYAQTAGQKENRKPHAKPTKRSRREVEEEEEQLMEDVDEDDEVTSREEPEGWEDATDKANEDDISWQERANREFERSKAPRGRHGLVAEMGVIEVIEMFDFMCHRHLKVPFGPKINFIIGHNGRGKANATNRAQSLKALIREGASQTEVRLQLRNRGLDAYKPEIYGESIIIERRISKDGTSGYKIKSSKGKTISTKRDELSSMCDHMNIQVDNPMNVLSQDTARQFLQSSSGEDKYKFFSKGTQLTQLSSDYEAVRECIDTMQNTLKNKTEILPELYELAKAAQSRFKDMQQAATLELKVEGLKHQVAWAQIEDLERDVEQTKEEVEKVKAKIPAIEKKRAQEEEAVAKLDSMIQDLEKKAGEHVSLNVPAQGEKRVLEQELRAKRDELKSVQDEERTVNEEIKHQKDQIRGFEQKIEQETRRLQANTQSRRAEVEEKIQRLEDEIDRDKRRLAETRELYSQLEQKVDEGRGRAEQINNAANGAKTELDDTKTRIRQIKEQKQNSLKAFGPTIPDVLRDIERVTNQGGWRGETPVGPLGRHIKLREQIWAPAIESALGNSLNAFAVTVDADRKTLSGILQRNRCYSDIILTRKVLFDYSSKEPSNKFLTINRVLDFDDEWVRRLLIDKHSIESTILIEKRKDADEITSSGRNGGFPDNVSQCFTVDLWRVGDRNGGASSLMMSAYKGPPRLSKNVDRELEVLEGNARRSEDSLRHHLRESKELMDEIERLDHKRFQAKKLQADLERNLKRFTRSAEDLRENLQEDEPDNRQIYEESKQQALQEIENMKKQYESIALSKQTITASMEPIREKIIKINEAIKAQESDALRYRSELDKLHIERQDLQPKIQYWESKLVKQKGSMHVLEQELASKLKYLEESTAKATEYCERVEVKATTAQLEREIKQILERLREQEAQRGCTLEEIATDMTRKQDEYKAAKAAIFQLNQLVKHLKTTLHMRLSRWRQFRSQMSLRSKMNFSLQLAQRGYSGELEFQHPEKKLTIRVETEDQNSSKAGVARDKDPKSLSGGEKSFSTICLLLALWDSMSSSIRCLDEFDVFMDAVNRRISMQMLINTARESDGVQYILITPQDASSVSPGPDVRVHRLHDPERNQQTIQ